jgi:hypothetical protein
MREDVDLDGTATAVGDDPDRDDVWEPAELHFHVTQVRPGRLVFVDDHLDPL